MVKRFSILFLILSIGWSSGSSLIAQVATLEKQQEAPFGKVSNQHSPPSPKQPTETGEVEPQTIDFTGPPAPFIHQRSLDDFSVAYEINAYTRDPHAMAATMSRLHESVQDHCNAAGIEILSPHYRANRDGNASTIPKPEKRKSRARPVSPVDEIKSTIKNARTMKKR